jgi:hypothetical protein
MKRSTRITLEWIAGFIGVGLVLGGLLFVRLAAGPLALDQLAPILAQRLGDPVRGITATVSSAALVWDEQAREVQWRMTGLVLTNASGGVVATVPKADARIRALPLLVGRVKLKSVRAEGANINLERTPRGQLALLGVEPQAKVDSSADFPLAALFAEWPERLQAMQSRLDSFGDVTVTATRVTIIDRIADTTLEGNLPTFTITGQRNGAVVGGGTLTFDTKPEPVALVMDMRLTPAKGTGEVIVSIKRLNPTTIGQMDQDYMGMLKVDMPLSGYLNITYLPDETMQMTVGIDSIARQPGRIMVPDLPEPLAVDSISLSASTVATGSAGASRATLNHFKLQSGPTTMTVTGSIGIGEHVDIRDIDVQATITNLPLNDVNNVWPITIGPNPRAWIVPNMRDGMMKEATFQLQGALDWSDGRPDFNSFKYSALGGSVTLEDALVDYYRPLPPAKGVRAFGVYDDKGIKIKVLGGTIADVTLRDGSTVEITGFAETVQHIETSAQLSGPLPSILTVMNSPPFEYPKKVGIDPQSMKADAQATLRIKLPLLNNIKMTDVELNVDGALKGFASTALVPGLKLADGDLKIMLDTQQMNITGPITVSGARVNVDWKEVFGPAAGRPNSDVGITANFNQKALADMGVALPGTMDGQLPLKAVYRRFADQPDTIAVTADLKPVGLNLNRLSLIKPKGQAGTLSANGTIDDDGVAIDEITATSAGMDIQGSASLDKDGALQELELSPFKVGGNDAYVDYKARADASPKIIIRGKQLNIGALMEDVPGQDNTAEENAAYDVTIEVERAVFAPEDRAAGEPEKFFAPFNLGAIHTKQGWRSIGLNTMAGGAVPFWVHLQAVPEGQHLMAQTPDLGRVLRALDWTNDIIGGALEIEGRSAGEGTPLTADILLTDYRVLNLPFMARLLNTLSLDGLLALTQSGKGLEFKRLKGVMVMQGDEIRLKNVRTSGGSLGLTLAGTLNAATNQIDIEGTVVPFSSTNKVIGSIPLIGNILTGGEGGGLFAATYYGKGKLDDPQFSVNPLSVLAPGFTRNLLFLDND